MLARFNNHFREHHHLEANQIITLYASMTGKTKQTKQSDVKVKDETMKTTEKRQTRGKKIKIDFTNEISSVSEDESTKEYQPSDTKTSSNGSDEDKIEDVLYKTEFGSSLRKFEQFLMSSEGGRKSQEMAKEDAARIKTLYTEVLKSQPVALSQIFTPTAYNDIWDGFFGPQLQFTQKL